VRSPLAKLYKLNGGQDDKSDPIEIPPWMFRSLLNFTVQRNSLHTRRGYVKEFQTALNGGATVQRVFQHEVVSNQTFLDTYIVGGSLYAGASQLDITNGITIASGADVRPVLATWDGKLIGTDGTNLPFIVSDPSSATSAAVLETIRGIPSKAEMVVPYKEHIIYANITDRDGNVRPYGLLWSNPFDPQNAGADQAQDLNRSQAIRAAVVHNDHLILFQERSTHTMFLEARERSMPFLFQQIEGNVGCPAFDLAINTEKGTFFIGQPNKGIYHIEPGQPGPPRYISKPLETFFAGVNWSRIRYGWVGEIPEKNLVVFGLPHGTNQTNNNKVICLNYDQWTVDADDDPHPAYSIWQGTATKPLSFASGYTITDADGRSRLITGGYDGFVYLMDEGALDDSEGISAELQTPFYDLGGGREVILLGLAIDGKLEGGDKTVTINYRTYRSKTSVTGSYTGGVAGSTFGVAVFGASTFGGNIFGTIPAQLKGRGRFFDMTLRTTDDFELDGITIYGDILSGAFAR